jgi:hypothetical protein
LDEILKAELNPDQLLPYNVQVVTNRVLASKGHARSPWMDEKLSIIKE